MERWFVSFWFAAYMFSLIILMVRVGLIKLQPSELSDDTVLPEPSVLNKDRLTCVLFRIVVTTPALYVMSVAILGFIALLWDSSPWDYLDTGVSILAAMDAVFYIYDILEPERERILDRIEGWWYRLPK